MKEFISGNIKLINETLAIILNGSYEINGKTVKLKLKKDQITESTVYSNEKVNRLINYPVYQNPISSERCQFSVENKDSFEVALDVIDSDLFKSDKNANNVLVLNFASPIYPGGGVLFGEKGQEEDLSRRSTLLISLLGKGARSMYEYNRNNMSFTASDYMAVSPNVEIIRGENMELLDDTKIVSVLTATAPIAIEGLQNIEEEELEKLIFNRILGMLRIAVSKKYEYLVLGAWGCGAFANDADVISRLFKKAFEYVDSSLEGNGSFFKKVVFAVLDNTEDQYNYKCFKNNF